MPDFDDRPKNSDVLNLEHLRAFIAVVELGSQVKASERLRIGQGTVSRHIYRVEQHFGAGLFESSRSGKLSSRGRIVEEAVRVALSTLERARERVTTERPVLRIGFIRLARQLVESALRNRPRKRTKVAFDVRLIETTSEAQARALERGELDVAVSFAIPGLAERADLEESVLAELPYALVVPEHAVVGGKPSVRALKPLHYVHQSRRLAPQVVAAGERWLAEHGITPERSLEQAFGTEVLAYAAVGDGYGFLPALWRAMGSDGVVFVPAPGFAATAKIAVYSQRHVTPWVAQLRESLSHSARSALAR